MSEALFSLSYQILLFEMRTYIRYTIWVYLSILQTSGGGKSSQEIIEDLAYDILQKIPQDFNLEEVQVRDICFNIDVIYIIWYNLVYSMFYSKDDIWLETVKALLGGSSGLKPVWWEASLL